MRLAEERSLARSLDTQPHMGSSAAAPEGLVSKTLNGDTLRVREVWEDNLEEEIAIIRGVVEDYPYVAMDTEFPGVVARPVGAFKSSREYHYRALKINVDMLKLIQLGLTFTDAAGALPVCNGEHTIWQFNFRGFKLSEDVYAQDSIELLKQSGIDFAQMEARGVDVAHFGELLMSSGIVLNDDVRWITFHSGYDFGYLLKVCWVVWLGCAGVVWLGCARAHIGVRAGARAVINFVALLSRSRTHKTRARAQQKQVLTCQPLPDGEPEFFELLNLYFPNVFDIK